MIRDKSDSLIQNYSTHGGDYFDGAFDYGQPGSHSDTEIILEMHPEDMSPNLVDDITADVQKLRTDTKRVGVEDVSLPKVYFSNLCSQW